MIDANDFVSLLEDCTSQNVMLPEDGFAPANGGHIVPNSLLHGFPISADNIGIYVDGSSYTSFLKGLNSPDWFSDFNAAATAGTVDWQRNVAVDLGYCISQY